MSKKEDAKPPLVLAVTGNRPWKLGIYESWPTQKNEKFKKIDLGMRKIIDRLKPAMAISGLALGVDQWAAQIFIDMDIPFIAAIPFDDWERYWSKEEKQEYRRLLKKAKIVRVVSTGGFATNKYQIRNEWMVDNATEVLAVYKTGAAGGTENTLTYAIKKKKTLHHIKL